MEREQVWCEVCKTKSPIMRCDWPNAPHKVLCEECLKKEPNRSVYTSGKSIFVEDIVEDPRVLLDTIAFSLLRLKRLHGPQDIQQQQTYVSVMFALVELQLSMLLEAGGYDKVGGVEEYDKAQERLAQLKQRVLRGEFF